VDELTNPAVVGASGLRRALPSDPQASAALRALPAESVACSGTGAEATVNNAIAGGVRHSTAARVGHLAGDLTTGETCR